MIIARDIPPRWWALTLAVLVGLSGCHSGDEENIHAPNGKLIKQLDARGRRHLVQNGKGDVIAKLRIRKDKVRVYDGQMLSVGDLHWEGDDLRITGPNGKVTSLPASIEGVGEIPAKLRIEVVERGWAVLDSRSSALGYFEWVDDGRLALRDDYSANPRLYASPEDHEAVTPAGTAELVMTPGYPVVVAMPFALPGKLGALERVALGMWLQRHKPRKK